MYERLAAYLVDNLDFGKVSTILEVGSGSGQFTVPFVKRVTRIKEGVKMLALDLSAGPYKGHLDTLRKRLCGEKLGDVIVPLNGDARNMNMIEAESVDLVVSNETLCEFNREGLDMAVREFFRVLKFGGQMVHGELIPAFENEAQKLVIDADLQSLATSSPKPEWFSPSSDEVAALLHKTGFKDIEVRYFETQVTFRRFSDAMKKLRRWRIDPVFIKERVRDIQRYGLEYPIEHLIFCRK
jgi:ubiquinone/menaquinone biosynthesis C-methylase UbiE